MPLRPASCLLACLACTAAVVTALAAAPAPGVAAYRKVVLDEKFHAEGSTFGDLNNDGHADAVAGPYWWEGPDFKVRHEYYPAVPWDPLRYSDNFFAFVHDFNGDGWNDLFIIGFPGVDASWYLNPGKSGLGWRRNVVFFPVDNESPTFARFFGPAKPPVLLCMSRGRLGYATFDPKNPAQPWVFHPVSPAGPYQRFTHGLGWGDVNADGRHDLLEKDGWREQPADLKGDPVWKHHRFPFSGVGAASRGGSQMYVYDVNADGKPDVIAALQAHNFGLAWFEQVATPDGAISFREHLITSRQENEKINGVQFGQPHAVDLADFDGDGVLDILAGKRWWAHGPTGDVQPNAAPVLYAFLLRRGPGGTATFVPHLIDDTTGVGTQVVAADVNRDDRPDIIVGNKRGTAVLLSQLPAKK